MPRALITATWDDVPHLSGEQKAALSASFSPHERDARTKGIPSLGSGAIYPVPLERIIEEPFALPDHWPRAYALDVGWNRTACLWGAWSTEDGTLHLYSEHYVGQAKPADHAAAIKARGNWIRGVADPASLGASQIDGRSLMGIYTGLGLSLTEADNSVEAGILEVLDLLSVGLVRVFSTLRSWASEYGEYRRDGRGRIVKERDHLMDAMRYLVRSGRGVARTRPAKGLMVAGPSGPSDEQAGY